MGSFGTPPVSQYLLRVSLQTTHLGAVSELNALWSRSVQCSIAVALNLGVAYQIFTL